VICDDIFDILSSGGISSAILFKSQLPDNVDTAVAILETGGEAPIRSFNTVVGSVMAEQPRVQIVSRALSYPTARTNIHTAWKLLENVQNRTINSVRYLSIYAAQSPFFLERDANNRAVCACNFSVVKERST